MADLRKKIAAADALLVATPEYNGSIPGALKNALDWASRPHGSSALAAKPVAVIGSSPSPFGAAWAQEALRRVLAIAGAQLLDTELTVGRVDGRFERNQLTDAGTREEVAALLGELSRFAAAREEAEEAVAA